VGERRERGRPTNRARPSDDRDAFVEDYFAQYHAFFHGSPEERLAMEHLESDQDRSQQLDHMILWGSQADTEHAWPILLALIERAPDEEALAFVAAGPLEDLIRNRHTRFGDRILDQARRDARFRDAVRCVWGWEELPEPFGGELRSLAGLRLIETPPKSPGRRRKS
jgi:hypothetical protein